MLKCEKDMLISDEYNKFIEIKDGEGNIIWMPYKKEHVIYSTPFPTNYIPKVGELFSLLDVKGDGIKGTYRLCSISSRTLLNNVIITLTVEPVETEEFIYLVVGD